MKKKFFVVITIIVVLVILLTPVRMNLKDGGSVRYKALVYEVTKIHRLAPEVDGVKPYIDGFEIKILGMTVYRETNELTNSSLPTCPLREEKSFSQSFFSIYTDIHKLQDKAKTSYTLTVSERCQSSIPCQTNCVS